MADSRKIATCCYCGTRAVLAMDRGRHTLACRSCGAPLSEFKAIPGARRDGPKTRATTVTARPATRREGGAAPRCDDPRRRRKKPRKPILRRLVEELWEEIGDLLD